MCSLDVYFSPRHRNSAWLDSLRSASTWNVKVLVVFGDSAMPIPKPPKEYSG